MPDSAGVLTKSYFWAVPALQIVLSVLNVLDYTTTKCALVWRIGFEKNPLSRFLLKIGLFTGTKLLMSTLLIVLAVYIISKKEKICSVLCSSTEVRLFWYFTGFLLLWTTVFYVSAVYNNIMILLTSQGV